MFIPLYVPSARVQLALQAYETTGGVDYTEARGGTFTPSVGGLRRRESIYNGFDDVADAES